MEQVKAGLTPLMARIMIYEEPETANGRPGARMR
jgi:hypothetical protein